MSFQQYGATGDEAGTSATLKRPPKPGRSSPYGLTGHVGVFEKGPVNRIMLAASEDLAQRIFGGAKEIQDSQAPLAMEDFHHFAKGAGAFYGLRVSDGNERQALAYLYSRDVDQDYFAGAENAKVPTLVGTIKSANGGRWGGQKNVYGGKVANVAAAISGSDFDTGLTGSDWLFKTDELKGATFTLEGETRTWTIDSNDDAGVISVEGDFVGVTATDGRWKGVLANQDIDNQPRALSVKVMDGTEDPDERFTFDVYEGRYVRRAGPDVLGNLELDPTGDYYRNLIRESLEVGQYEVTMDESEEFAGDVTLDQNKPANFAEIAIPGGVGTNTVQFRIMTFTNTGTGDGYFGTLVDGGAMVPHKLVLTVLAGAATYSVAAYDISGNRLLASGLTAGTIGVAYAAPHTFMSGHTLSNGGTPYIEGDVITVYVRPLPTGLNALGCWFHPYAYGATGTGSKDVTTRYRVMSNTYDTITLGPNEDVNAVVAEPELPVIVSTTDWSGTLNTLGLTFKYKLQGAAEQTLTMVGHAAQTLAQAIVELEALDLANNDELTFGTYTDAAGLTYLQVTADDDKYGPSYYMQVTNGTLNAVCGFTNDETDYGTTPTVGRLEYKQEFEIGRDGHADIAAAHYIAAFDTGSSPILDLTYEDIGCLKLGCPGVTTATVQQAGLDFAKEFGCVFRPEIPSTVANAMAARKWIKDNLTPNDYIFPAFPSYGYLAVNPFGGSTKYLNTFTGAIHGIEADYASRNEGYQKPATDTEALLTPRYSSLPTDLDSGKAVALDNAILNGSGIQEIRHRGPSIWIWGDRGPGLNFKRQWKHKMECYLHIVREHLANGDPLAFKITDGEEGEKTRQKVMGLSRSLMLPHVNAAGGNWFSEGPDIKCDDETTSQVDLDAGKLICATSFKIVNTNERTEFHIGENGLVY